MTFRRFLAWIIEKLFEMQLLVLLLVAVKFLLPTGLDAYSSLPAFISGMSAQWYASLDEAAFMSSAFMEGNYAVYAYRTWQAAAWVIGIHFYFWSFYLFTSIFACLAGDRGYLRNAILAFLVSAGVLVWRQREMFDIHNIALAITLLSGGVLVVIVSCLFGRYVDFRLAGGRTMQERIQTVRAGKRDSSRGRVRFDLSQ